MVFSILRFSYSAEDQQLLLRKMRLQDANHYYGTPNRTIRTQFRYTKENDFLTKKEVVENAKQ